MNPGHLSLHVDIDLRANVQSADRTPSTWTFLVGLNSDSRVDGRCLSRHEVHVIYFRALLTGRRRSRSPAIASAAECQGENFEVFCDDVPGLQCDIGPLVGPILGGTWDAVTEPRTT
jgi:hypothetical protein